MRAKVIKITAFGACLVLPFVAASVAHAASCSGVPQRVNNKTANVRDDVISKMQEVERSIINESIRQTEQIISAMRVVNTASNAAAQQQAAMTKSASEASASAWVAHRTNMLTMEATQRYRSMGYNTCGSISAAKSFAQSNAEVTQRALSSSSGVVKDTEYKKWFANAQNNTGTANDVLEGNEDAARQYIAMALGPQPDDIKALDGTVGKQLLQLSENRKTALKSLASFVMMNAASYKESDKKLDEFTSSWIGKDGGEKWASAMAASHERGVMLDQVRIEAANVAARAYSIKKRLNTELAVAGYALARTDTIVSHMVSGSNQSQGANVTPANLEKAQ